MCIVSSKIDTYCQAELIYSLAAGLVTYPGQAALIKDMYKSNNNLINKLNIDLQHYNI